MQIYEGSTSWDNSSPVNTYKLIDIPRPVDYLGDRDIEVIVKNQSDVTDLCVSIGNIRTVNSISTYCELAAVTAPKALIQLIENCEDAWDEQSIANITSTTSATKIVGTYSASIAATSSFTTGLMASEAVSSMSLAGYNTIRLWINSSINTTAGQLVLYLDDTALCASPLETLPLPALTANTWTKVYLPLTNRANDNNIISIGIGRAANLGAQTILIDDVNALYINTKEFPVAKLFVDDVPAQLWIYSTTALGAYDGFSAYIKLVGA